MNVVGVDDVVVDVFPDAESFDVTPTVGFFAVPIRAGESDADLNNEDDDDDADDDNNTDDEGAGRSTSMPSNAPPPVPKVKHGGAFPKAKGLAALGVLAPVSTPFDDEADSVDVDKAAPPPVPPPAVAVGRGRVVNEVVGRARYLIPPPPPPPPPPPVAVAVVAPDESARAAAGTAAVGYNGDGVREADKEGVLGTLSATDSSPFSEPFFLSILSFFSFLSFLSFLSFFLFPDDRSLGLLSSSSLASFAHSSPVAMPPAVTAASLAATNDGDIARL